MASNDREDLAWAMLEQQIVLRPDKDFLRFSSGSLSYAEFAELACGISAALSRRGIGPGDIVPSLLPNGALAVALWFGLMRVGATWAPINTEFRGEQLTAALNATKARIIIVGKAHMDVVLGALPALSHVRSVIVHGEPPPPDRGETTFCTLEPLDPAAACDVASVSRGDVAMIQFTSGSTGMSKAVQLSHGYLAGQARLTSRCFGLREDDVVYCPFPLYHWDATIGTVMGALARGATAALGDRFSVSRFWDDIRAFEATIFDFMGATLAFLFDKPPSCQDRDHRVRLAWGLPLPPFREEFEKRFGFPLLEGYGSTEGGVCVFQELGKNYPEGSCGRLAPEYQLKILDEMGEEVPAGETGEIVTRPHDPTMMMNGYLDLPEVNAELIRDGWFFTGDLGRLDSDGNLFFEGRKKDIIRRRGENISALEVEREVESHPAVLEAAAFGAPSPFTEEEVAVAVVLREGSELSEADLRAYCQGRMARYMVPEHVMFVAALPKTPTEKVAKPELKRMFESRHRA